MQNIDTIFEYGSSWVRADFHLHTKADKEFSYDGQDRHFATAYLERLSEEGIKLGVIANHNKFDTSEFKVLRKTARKKGIGLLPGVELSVNDGANGVHTLVVFSDDWLAGGQDYISQFLNVAFSGKTAAQYQHENGRSNDDLSTTLKKLTEFNRDFFVVFAHVEASSGLWKEIDGGRLKELAKNPFVQKYCLGFQKVRTHDKPDAKCRVKVKQWWGDQYPAEVEGSDPKNLEEVGRGKTTFLKLGDLSFDAVKYALTDFECRVDKKLAKAKHSRVDAISFEGGLLKGERVTFSPHLNCLIGIQGSGKSSVLEGVRYALGISIGQDSQDIDYKNNLLPHVLKSGGKIIVQATDRHGTKYEIHRILGNTPDVYVDGQLRPGVSIQETVVTKPLYFGQKDLSAAGKGFGHDLVEKLMGDGLRIVQGKIAERADELEEAVENLLDIQSDAEEKQSSVDALGDVNFRLEQFDKHGVKGKLEKQVGFGDDVSFCETIDEIAEGWQNAIQSAIEIAEEDFGDIGPHKSKHNSVLFEKYDKKLQALKATISKGKALVVSIGKIRGDLEKLRQELEKKKSGLKEEFAETERELVRSLEEAGVTSIEPDAYIELTDRKAELEAAIADLEKKTSKEKVKHDDVIRKSVRLNDAWHEEYKLIAKALEKINAAQTSLKVVSTFKGDTSAFCDHIETLFRGNSFRKETYQKLSSSYTDFGEVFKDLEAASAHAKSKSTAFKECFMEHLFELLSYQVPNSFEVIYHDKLLKSHSLGQRASAMMLFLLSQDDNDLLLIDQPEDDLDSQTIYEEVVKLLKTIKQDRQFIFATHNANFPVLGDAEMISACSAQDETISITGGNIDTPESQRLVIDIMEGGPEAFERRNTIYQIWKSEFNHPPD
jgi:hypothetical protein